MSENQVKTSEFCLNYFKFKSNNASSTEQNDTEYLDSQISDQMEKYVNIICEKRDDFNLFLYQNSIKLYILKYVYPLLLAFGMLGNIISIVVMIRIYRRKKHSYKFSFNLAALSIADLAVLIFGCFREYSDDILDWRLRSTNFFLCKMIYFNCYLFSCFSAYLHAFISVERWYAIANPIRFKTGAPRNKRTILIIFLTCFFISSPLTLFADVKEFLTVNEQSTMQIKIVKECELTLNNYFFDLILAIIDFVLVCSIPFLVTFLFSIFSLVRLYKTKNATAELLFLDYMSYSRRMSRAQL